MSTQDPHSTTGQPGSPPVDAPDARFAGPYAAPARTPGPATPLPAAEGPGPAAAPDPADDGVSPSGPATTIPRPASDASPAGPRTTARRRLLVVGAAALLVLGVGATVVVNLVNTRVFGPQHLAQDYLDALEDGRAGDALALVAATAGSDEYGSLSLDTSLLSDEVYADATDRPTQGSVKDVRLSGGTATITVRYRQGTITVEQTIEAERVGRTAGLFDRWELRPTVYGELTVSAASGQRNLVIGDQELTSRYGSWTLAALPGTYTLSGTSSRWLDARDVRATVLGDGSTRVSDALTAPNAALAEKAPQVVEEFLAACVASTLAQPDGCPNSSIVMSGATDIVWTLDVAPQFAIEESYSGDGYYVRGTSAGSATATGTLTSTTLGHPAGEQFSFTVDLTLSGRIWVEGDQVSYDDYSRS
jgi:hypothetical protein